MENITNNKKIAIFETLPIPQAVASLVVPAIISQLIIIIYNLADTYFIGQMNDAYQVAAVSLCLPLLLVYTAIANLLGVGGSSVIARFLGKGEKDSAKAASSFCIWSSVGIAVLYALCVYLFKDHILYFFGADETTYRYSKDYMLWAIIAGGLTTTLNPLLAYLIRAEGSSFHASIGMSLGALLNIVLDPIMIIHFGWEIKGAAIATMIGNTVATCYFLLYIALRRFDTIISLKPTKNSFKKNIMKEIILVGLPSCCLSLLSTLSNSITNILVSSYNAVALAGVGIAKKINLTAFALAQGLGQGILPLIGYNYAKGNFKRLRKAIKFSTVIAAILSLSCMVIALLFSKQLVGYFIADIETVGYGSRFLRIICLAMPTSTFLFICITYFQAIGQKKNPLIISILRKGTTDVLLMFLFNNIVGLNGILWATPIADIIAVIVSFVLLVKYIKKVNYLSLGKGD